MAAFVEDDEIEDGRKSHVYLWKDFEDDACSESAVLANIAQDFADRGRCSRTTKYADMYDSSHGFIHLLPSEKDLIWSVRVKVRGHIAQMFCGLNHKKKGSERDVVFAVFQKALLHPPSRPDSRDILACFAVDSLAGSVYVEAKSFPAVVKILEGISGVARRSRNGPSVVKAINIQDMPLLLSMEHPVIRLSSWARIKSGLYKGDLALVREFDALSQLYEVYVVPRLAYGGKRKRGNRPPAAPFDAALAERTFNSKVEVRNQARLFRGKLYLSGLYLAEFHTLKLTTEGVNATTEELQHFQHLPEWEEARNLIFPIKEGDRVRVVSGTFKGGWGTTSEVKTASLCLFWEDSRQDIREVLMRDVRRFFRLGDYVEILYGPNRGDQGFIVHLAGSEAVVYTRHSPGVSTDRFGGYEVSKFLTHHFGGAELSLSH
jgi:hypothetical protein